MKNTSWWWALCLIGGGLLWLVAQPVAGRPVLAGRQAAVPPADPLTRALDSLKTLLRRPALPDSVRIRTLVTLGRFSMDRDLPGSRRYLQQALDFARQRHDVAGQLTAAGNLGYLDLYSEDYLSATQRYQQLLREGLRRAVRSHRGAASHPIGYSSWDQQGGVNG